MRNNAALRVSARFALSVLAGCLLPAPYALAEIDIPENTWVEVFPQTNLPPGHSYQERGWTDLVYSSAAGEFISYEGFRNGGSHTGTIYSQAVWGYDVATNRLVLRKRNNWTTPGDGNSNTTPMPENSSDPTPADRHPYRCLAEVPSQNGIYLWGGANQTLGGGHPADTWRFNLGSNDWTQLIGNGQSTLPKMVENQMAYDPQHNEIVMYGTPSSGAGGTWIYDVAGNSWSGPFDDRPGSVKAGKMVYDPVRDRMLMFGGPFGQGGNNLWTYNTDTRSWSLINAGANLPPKRRMMGFAYDSRNDIFLLFGGKVPGVSDGFRDSWVFLPDQDRWAELSPAQVPNSSDSPAHVDMAYDSTENVFLARWGRSGSPTWWIYRYGTAPPPGNPPPAPNNLIAK